MAGTEDVDYGMAHDQENPVRDEHEILRVTASQNPVPVARFR